MNIKPGLLRIWTRKFQKQHLNSVSQNLLPVLLSIISNRFFFPFVWVSLSVLSHVLSQFRTWERRWSGLLNPCNFRKVFQPTDLLSLPLKPGRTWMSREHKTYMILKQCLLFLTYYKTQIWSMHVSPCDWQGLMLTCDPYWSGSLFTPCCDLMRPLERSALKYNTTIHFFWVVGGQISVFIFSH